MESYLDCMGQCCDRDSNKGPQEHRLFIIKAVKKKTVEMAVGSSTQFGNSYVSGSIDS